MAVLPRWGVARVTRLLRPRNVFLAPDMKNINPTRVFAGVVAALVGGIGLFTLLAWGLDSWEMVTMGSDYIPMAPITALLFALLAAALAGRLWLADRRWVAGLTHAGVGLAILIAGAELVRVRWPFALPWDHWGFGVETGFGVMQIGRMASLTAVVFILTALGFVGTGAAFASSRWVRYPANLAALAGLLVCSLVVLAYIAGTPMGYMQGNVPMAWLTATAFVILNAGMIAENRAGQFFSVWRTDQEHAAGIRHVARSFRQKLLLVLVTVMVTSGLVGFYYLRQQRSVIRHNVEEQLEAVVNLKVGQLQHWRAERLHDAGLAATMPHLAEWIETLARDPRGADSARTGLAEYFRTLQRVHGYRQIVLWDGNLVPVFVSAEDPAEALCLPDELRRQIREAKEPLMKDLHRVEGGRVHLGFLAPLRTQGGDQFVGAVQLVVDPSTVLYPLVVEWPSSSETGESVLVRQDGADVLYLNELRHHPGSALQLRIPQDSPTLMVARAIRSKAPGLLEGTDYRGVPAVSVVRRVPGTAWLLIAKMDQVEAYAAIRAEVITVIVGVLLIAGLVGLFLRSVWQEKQEELTYQQLHLERKSRAASERLAHLMQHAGEVILLFDENRRIVEANQRVKEIYGRTPAEMIGLSARDLRPADAAADIPADFSRAMTEAGHTFETIHVRQDGSSLAVEVNARPVVVDGRKHVLSIIRDISLRKMQEEEIARLSRLYFVISQINQILLHVKNRQELFDQVCAVLVKVGGFRVARIDWLEVSSGLLRTAAVAGDHHDLADEISAPLNPALPGGRGPSRTAFREGRIVVCNDYFTEGSTQPWHERVRPSGFRSSIALPLRTEGRPVGLLAVYSEHINFFAPREVALLEETADNLAFALEVFAHEARREAVEAEHRKLSMAVEQSPASIVITDPAGNIEYINPHFTAVTGYTLAEVRGQNPRVLKSGLTAPAVYEELWRTITQGEKWRGEIINRKKNGETHTELVLIAPVKDATGRVTHYLAVKEDITRSKQVEDELRQSDERFRAMFESNLDGVMITLLTGEILTANPAACAMLGRTEAEICQLGRTGLVDPQDPRVRALVEDRRRTGKARGVITLLRGDGTRFEAEISSAVFGTGAQQRNGLVLRDITEQLRAEMQMRHFNEDLEAKVAARTEQLIAANNEMQALLQSIPDMVMRVNRGGTVTSYQPAKGATPLAALSERELIEARRGAAESLRALVRTVGEKTLAACTPVVAEDELPMSAGLVAVELRAAPISGDDFVVFVRDVTARKRFEAEMAATLEKERQVSEMKTRFISVTSHEFRTPMAAALGSVELLTNHLDRLSPAKRGELLTRITQSLQRMTQMLDEILLLNRMEANRVEVRLVPLELAEFARSLVDEIRLGDQVGHVIELERAGLNAAFVTDPNLLHHILGNILSNAVRYSPAGSPIRVHLAVEAGTMRFIVEDHGIGIPPADLHRIFEPFERGSNVGNIKGTGLGLNIVKRMVDLLHGEIFVSSTPAGSSFTVMLPSQTTPPLSP